MFCTENHRFSSLKWTPKRPQSQNNPQITVITRNKSAINTTVSNRLRCRHLFLDNRKPLLFRPSLSFVFDQIPIKRLDTNLKLTTTLRANPRSTLFFLVLLSKFLFCFYTPSSSANRGKKATRHLPISSGVCGCSAVWTTAAPSPGQATPAKLLVNMDFRSISVSDSRTVSTHSTRLGCNRIGGWVGTLAVALPRS